MALGATVLASGVAFLDSTVVNVAVPAIADDFGVGGDGVQWVLTAYLLTLASLILLGGALGDRYGSRRVFVVGAVWFALATLACALAPSLWFLVLARLFQGVGGALLTPTSLALVQASFVPDDRARAVGAWAGLTGLSGAIGPILGGWLIDGPGWRWAFVLSVPLVLVSVVAVRATPTVVRVPGGRFDLAGAGLAVVALAGLTLALNRAADDGWGDPLVVVASVAAIVASVAFVVWERRSAAPLVPGRLFESRTFTVLSIVTFALYALLGGVFFFVVYQLQVVTGFGALAAASSLIPATLLLLFGSARSGALATRWGPRPQMVVGPLLTVAGVVVLAGIDVDTSWTTGVLPGSILLGLGLVAFVAPLTASVMACVDQRLVGTASGVNNAIARTAGLVALAVIPSVSGLTVAVGTAATTSAFRWSMAIAAALGLVAAAVSALFLPRRVRPPAADQS
ncbi:MFS transporter [Rhabdothermincola salaria]|uniref:MFS transporter n=1 Tax=Rhabdothermincola salaria TaxID=2903142 RepID=UPI001E4B38EC|nr:MFS transporter [Rhabdothermincola salaria]